MIGYATSIENELGSAASIGVSWTKHAEPVLRPSTPERVYLPVIRRN